MGKLLASLRTRITNRCEGFLETDHAAFAWSGLRHFRNPDLVERRIRQLHEVPAKQSSNVKKQARQLRYCLVQAEEYRTAARAVGLPTRPNLYYYSAMSLALAEILLTHDGAYSLDRAREQHKHHGLSLAVDGLPNPTESLAEAATKLRAVPHISGGVRYGTFELYHQTCRETPAVGVVTRSHAEGQTKGIEVIWGVADKPLPPLPLAGISLFQCMQHLPGMQSYLTRLGIPSKLLRARLARDIRMDQRNKTVTNLIVHPGPADLLNTFWNNIRLDFAAVNHVDLRTMPSGGIFTVTADDASAPFNFVVPQGTMLSSEDYRLWVEDVPLNEFGYLLVALYIAGNYARYYPDRWLQDIEASSQLALAIEQLIDIADRRAALLTLSELDGRYHVPMEYIKA
jgi:hypothetical protein